MKRVQVDRRTVTDPQNIELEDHEYICGVDHASEWDNPWKEFYVFVATEEPLKNREPCTRHRHGVSCIKRGVHCEHRDDYGNTWR